MTLALIGLGLLILAVSTAGIIGFRLAQNKQLKVDVHADARIIQAESVAIRDPAVLANVLRRGGQL